MPVLELEMLNFLKKYIIFAECAGGETDEYKESCSSAIS
jgi:hypothetical protein